MSNLSELIGEEGLSAIRMKIIEERFISAKGNTADIKNTPYITGEFNVKMKDGRTLLFTIEPITDEDVQKFGKPSCNSCYGRGKTRIQHPQKNHFGKNVKVENSIISDGTSPAGEDGFSEETCICAMKNFAKSDRGQDVYKDVYQGWYKLTSARFENPI